MAGQCGVLQIYLQTPIRRGGAPSGAAGLIANNLEVKTFRGFNVCPFITTRVVSDV